MGVDVPSDYTIDLTLDGGVTLDGSLDSNIQANLTLPTSYDIGISQIPRIELGITQIPKIQMGLDPVDLSLRLKEFPSIRAHLPANFKVGLSLLGVELMAIRLCGEAQIVTEDYEANPCETCGGRQDGRLTRIDLVAGNG